MLLLMVKTNTEKFGDVNHDIEIQWPSRCVRDAHSTRVSDPALKMIITVPSPFFRG